MKQARIQINAIFITQATVLDAQRPSALARVFGATPRQVSSGLTVAQLIPALIAGILSLSAGSWCTASPRSRSATRRTHRCRRGGWLRSSSGPWRLAVLTMLPADAGARRPVAEVLRAE